MVGWFPRLHSRGAARGAWRYHGKLSTLLLWGAYSMLLSKGAFLHAGTLGTPHPTILPRVGACTKCLRGTRTLRHAGELLHADAVRRGAAA